MYDAQRILGRPTRLLAGHLLGTVPPGCSVTCRTKASVSRAAMQLTCQIDLKPSACFKSVDSSTCLIISGVLQNDSPLKTFIFLGFRYFSNPTYPGPSLLLLFLMVFDAPSPKPFIFLQFSMLFESYLYRTGTFAPVFDGF